MRQYIIKSQIGNYIGYYKGKNLISSYLFTKRKSKAKVFTDYLEVRNICMNIRHKKNNENIAYFVEEVM